MTRGAPTVVRRDLDRRRFLALAGALPTVLLARHSSAQAPAGTSPDPQTSSSNLGPMDQDAARTVRRPPKTGASPGLTVAERDDLEHRIRCQCGCTLDVYTCRTTDFSCQVSPAMHRDVMSLVDGGYDAKEIVAAFEQTYGEQVLMAPTKEGFNLVGWIMPFAALATGAVVVGALVRRWSRRAAMVRVAEARRPAPAISVDATPEELARLDAAVRGDAR